MPIVVCDPKKKTSHRNSVLVELRAMEKVAYDLVIRNDTEPQHVAQLMRAYVEAERQRNVIRMKPVPKPIEVGLDGKPVKAGRKRGSISSSQGGLSDVSQDDTPAVPGPQNDTSAPD